MAEMIKLNPIFTLLCFEMGIRAAGLIGDIEKNLLTGEKIDGKNRIVQLKEIKDKFQELEAYLRVIEENYDRIKVNQPQIETTEFMSILEEYRIASEKLLRARAMVMGNA